jgi:drug/metabolite transporter (DMT)-like permease
VSDSVLRTRGLLGAVCVIIAAICFGFMGLFRAWAAGVSVEMVLFLRFAIAGAVMLVILLARGERWPRGNVLLGLIVMGAALYVAESLFFFHALAHIPQGLVSLLLYIYPVVVTLVAWLFLREKMTRIRMFALILAACGLALTIGPTLIDAEPMRSGANTVLGVSLGLACCVSYAVYILIGGGFTRRAGAIPGSTVVIISAAVVLGAVSLGKGDALPNSSDAWLGVTLLALASTVIAITCVLVGLASIGPVQTSTLSTLEPVATVIVGALWLNERLNWIQICGGILIVSAAIIIARATAARDDQVTASNIDVAEIH